MSALNLQAYIPSDFTGKVKMSAKGKYLLINETSSQSELLAIRIYFPNGISQYLQDMRSSSN
jgi:hypothetical protein